MTKRVVSLVQSDLKLQLAQHGSQNSNRNSFRDQQHTTSDNPKSGQCNFFPKITCPKTARPLATSKGLPATFLNMDNPMQDVAKLGKATAMPGTALLAVIRAPLVNVVNTGVLCEDQKHTMPKNVTPCCDVLAIITPFIPDEWKQLLSLITPFNKFSNVLISMCFGFDMGIKNPPTHTYTPPNHNSATFYPSHILSHIHNEISLRCYSGPFSKSRLEYLIGAFQTSPLGTVPKSGNAESYKIYPSQGTTLPVSQ